MTILKLLCNVALVTATMTGPTTALAASIAQPADFSAQAAALLDAAYPADGPGAAVVVMLGGRVIFSGGRGLADLEARRPITPDTAFRLGSITKQFTAAVILQLVAERRISLDDPISRFFPDYPQPGARATVRQLLNHVSGIQDYSKIPGWMGGEQSLRPNTTADLVAVIRSRPSPSAPGQRWEYNNGGYTMLGAIIEQVSGKPWHQAVTERIAQPLGLATIAYAGKVEGDPATARGYGEEGGRQRPARGVHISVAHAAGGLVGSVSDMARWAQALHHGRVVSPELYREMIRPARLANGSTEPYGFGLRLRQIRGRPVLVHGGAGRGLDTDSAYIPSEDLFVAVFSNSDDAATDPAMLVRRLAALALGEPIPTFTRADIDLRSIEPLFGAYEAKDGPPRRFLARDGKIYIGRGVEEVELFAAGDDRFFDPGGLTWLKIARRADGAHVMEIHRPDAAAADRAVRTGPAPAALAVSPEVLQDYVGSYATEGPVVTVALNADGGLTIAPAGQNPLAMRAVSETEFRIEGGMMRVVFHRENDEVNRLTIYRGARELHGRRVSR
ncbi:serine hydrolase domain-containing protein [Sphingomonas gilva]|nr:serine hydrolase domain-containing protein [Sphingomonas gilva]